MKGRLRGLWLAAAVIALVASGGCRPASQSGVQSVGAGLAWYPGTGAGVVGSEGPAIDWARALDELPQPALGSEYPSEYDRYSRAVRDVLRQAYSADRRVVIEVDEQGYEQQDMSQAIFGCIWGRFPNELEVPDDPFLGEAVVDVGFCFKPATPEASAYAVAGEVIADEHVKWDTGESRTGGEEKRSMALGASLRILRLAVGRFLPVGDEFWSAFDALQSLAVAGYLPDGQWDLPGTHGGDIRLAIVVVDALDGYGHITVNLQPLAPAPGQSGEVVAGPGGWADAVAGLPPAGFGDRLMPFFEGLVAAVRRYPGGDGDTLVSLVQTPVSEDVGQVTLRCLRPASDGSGFRLELLTLNLAAGTSGSGGARAVEIMELLAWDPRALSQAAGGSPAQPVLLRIAALVPARDVAIERYLPLDGDFTSATADLSLVKGLEAKLPGRDGTAILLSVRDLSWAPGASVLRYTLTVVEDTGG